MKLGFTFITVGLKDYDLSFNDFEMSQNQIVNIRNNVQEWQFLLDFMQIFANPKLSGERILRTDSYIAWIKERKENFERFVEKYKRIVPKLNALKNYLDQRKENEYFCLLLSEPPIDTSVRIDIWEELCRLNKIKPLGLKEIFSTVVEDYNLFSFAGEEDRKIGQIDRTKRVCRWCHNKNGTVTFKEKAHAISEALGNKTLIILDECDSCNHRFANTIERDVINYFKFPNVIWGVKGKRGTSKIKTPLIEITNTGNDGIKIIADQELSTDGSPTSLKIDCGNVKGQNVYKAFCKYVLSLVDDDVLKLFNWTVDWINGDEKVNDVPVVKLRFLNRPIFDCPVILLHIRKNDNDNLPQMFGILYHTNSIHLFIVPKDKQELDKFVNRENFENFVKTLPYGCTSWNERDFSSDIEQPFGAILNVQQIQREK